MKITGNSNTHATCSPQLPGSCGGLGLGWEFSPKGDLKLTVKNHEPIPQAIRSTGRFLAAGDVSGASV